jgi:hypothetical protein
MLTPMPVKESYEVAAGLRPPSCEIHQVEEPAGPKNTPHFTQRVDFLLSA